MDWNSIFDYDEQTGNLVWRFNKKKSDQWNGRYAGRVAGCRHKYSNGNGYRIRITMAEGAVYAHRVIWLMKRGPIPHKYFPDHKDCDGTNNRLSNLRLATHAENCRNRRIRADNKCGLKGVSWDGFSWHAQINIGGKNTSIGRYPTKGLAAVAYAKASIRYHGQFARIR